MEGRQGEEEIFETPDLEVAGETTSENRVRLVPSLEQMNDPENVIPTPLNADAAFEVFHGKRYQTPGVDLSGSIAYPSRSIGGGAGSSRASAAEASILPREERPFETPIQRYLRLKAEASQLADEVDALVTAGAGVSSGGDLELEPASLYKHLAQDVAHLKGELTTLAQGPGAKILGAATGKEEGGDGERIETDLAEALIQKIGELTHRAKKGGDGASGKDATTAAAAGQVVYELYYDPTRHSSSGSSSQPSRIAQLQALEGRLAVLERALIRTEDDEVSTNAAGEVGGMVLISKTLPLVDAIAKVEKQAVLLDAVSIETLRQRLALLKNEWDDFKKERVKHGNNLERDASTHYRRIQALYEQLQKLEHVGSDLPSLVSRLQVLQDLHTQSLQFNQRVQQLEGGQDVLKNLLTSTGQSLAEVKKSLAENVAQMAENIKAIDKRMEALLATRAI